MSSHLRSVSALCLSLFFSGASLAVDNCGDFSSSGNPFPCCTHSDGTKGNCTWWAWKKSKDQWGITPVNKGNAGTWASNKSSEFSVSSDARSPSVVEFGGHVAWVSGTYQKCLKKDKKGKCTSTELRITGTEMNCPDQYSAYRSFDYAASNKKYIYKK